MNPFFLKELIYYIILYLSSEYHPIINKMTFQFKDTVYTRLAVLRH
jgi:hypothetical protein